MDPEASWPEVPVGLAAEIERIARTVLSKTELGGVFVGWGPETGPRSWGDLHPSAEDGETMLVAKVVACGEEFVCSLWQPGVLWEGLDDFVSQLEDWIAESTFGWGQQRLVPRL